MSDVSSFIMILKEVRHCKAVTECSNKLTGQVLSHLQDAEVKVRAYEDFASTLQTKVRDGCKAPCAYWSYLSYLIMPLFMIPFENPLKSIKNPQLLQAQLFAWLISILFASGQRFCLNFIKLHESNIAYSL